MKKPILLILIAFVCLAFNTQNASAQVAVGAEAPAFNLPECSNKSSVSFDTYKDAKGYILVFTCNHCPFSVLYEDRIIALHNASAPKGFPVIAINSNDPTQYPEDSFKNMAKRKKEKAFPFAYVFDETQEIAKQYGAERTPHVFLVKNEGGKRVVAYIGAIDNNAKDPALVTEKYVEKAIDAIIKGESVNPDFTKAIGCGIKWKKA